MGEVSRRAKVARVLALFAIGTGCSVGAPSTFTLTSASVDESYVCPTSASDLAYTIHATIDVRNGTSSSVTIRSVTVVMTLAAVKGGWLEHVGDKYAAARVSVSPETASADSSASLNLSIPSTSTTRHNPRSSPTPPQIPTA